MDFFERLGERASLKRYGLENDTYINGFRSGVRATIEALKEMMVGEARPNNLSHVFVSEFDLGRITVLRKPFHGTIGKGEIGTDGEQVVVMVFRW